MPPRVRLVHQTRDRVRLRIPEKRKDLDYFVRLYEDVRQIPGVQDLVINPDTGSVLLHFPGQSGNTILRSLHRIGLLEGDSREEGPRGARSRIADRLVKDRGGPGELRTVLMVVILGLAIHQIRRGILLAPALTVLWYAYDLLVSRLGERARLTRADTTPDSGT